MANNNSVKNRQWPLAERLSALALTHQGNDKGLRLAVLDELRAHMAADRAAAQRGLEEKRLKGAKCAETLSAQMDAMLATLADFVSTHVLFIANPTDAEKVTMVAVGGYGRGRLAPHSDIDLLFLLPYKRNATSESFVEYILYMLWDLGLKVGHATRTVNECVTQAQADMTVRTAMLESRCLWGSSPLFEAYKEAFQSKVMQGTARQFVTAKLAERDERHEKTGRSRYLVEPNLKEGKGGLRDLNTLFWIARYSYQVEALDDLVGLGVLTAEELRLFRKCDDFLWHVRCHLHFLTNMAQERLSFDVQKPMAAFFYPSDVPSASGAKKSGMKPVEKFMRRYFLVAKNVGDLTAIFCASLEAAQKKPRAAARLPALFRRQKQVDGFTIGVSRLKMTRRDIFTRNAVNLIRVFHLADTTGLDIHPDTLRAITQHTHLIDEALRQNETANKLFLDLLTSKRDPERILRRMNEAGVLGRFVPDFGRIVALMQFNMYHHYTADEHLLRALGLLREIEKGAVSQAHPLATELLNNGSVNRRVIYLATFLHDIAKGRPEDHSIAGARIARKLGPRLGFSKAETALTEWLVREHLVMSDVAQRRDLSDPHTVEDFAKTVQSMERLNHLFVLTEVDIKAVGPGVFNGWKAQLLRELYAETASRFNAGTALAARGERLDGAKTAFAQLANKAWKKNKLNAYMRRQSDAYWLSFSTEAQVRHADMIAAMEEAGEPVALEVHGDKLRDCSEITIICQDHAGLFARLAGACALAGLTILDARITTTRDGLAIDALHVADRGQAGPLSSEKASRLITSMRDVLSGRVIVPDHLDAAPQRAHIEAFDLAPQVRISNQLADNASVIEVSGLDRQGLLYALLRALFDLNLSVSAARIATFGERVVDVFHVTDLSGAQITEAARQKKLRAVLRRVINNPVKAAQPKKPTRRSGSDKRGKSKAA
ncbi:MAG: [protein-PII] uridylyltransferase [Rhodobiaceae bacterium]|nr:[protein-PII] uridylyltransferase [Rhodobiaceae bacterium]